MHFFNIIYRKYIKRLIDICMSIIAIILLSPIFLIVGFLIKVKLGSPIIFKQKRPGLDGKIFTMYKFRTMTNKRDSNGLLLPDEVRLTKFGRILRSTSIDELPELFNIIKGDMSFVGPRPLLIQYLPLYSDQQKRRHEVRPGLTGLAQVNGRNSINWERKFQYDVEYVDNVSFLEDIKIMYKTVIKVLSREGINSETSATMEIFRGEVNEK